MLGRILLTNASDRLKALKVKTLKKTTNFKMDLNFPKEA